MSRNGVMDSPPANAVASRSGHPVDLSQNLFRRYNRIMGRVLIGIFLVAATLLYLQVDRNLAATKEMLTQRVQENAIALEAILERTTNGVRTLQYAAQQRYRTNPPTSEPSLLLSSLLASAREGMMRLDAPPPPWTLRDLGNLTGKAEPRDPSRLREIEMALSLNPMLAAIRANNTNTAWAYYSSARNFINIYPWVSSSTFAFDPSLYEKEFFRLGLPEANPARTPFWTAPYVDDAGLGLMITAAAPVYEGDVFRGTVAIDLTLEDLNRFVGKAQPRLGTLLIAGSNGTLLAQDGLSARDAQSVPRLESALPEPLRADAEALLTEAEGGFTVRAGYYVLSQTLPQHDFRLVLLVPRPAMLLDALHNGLIAAVSLITGLMLMLGVATWLTRREFIGPADRLVRYIGEESRGAAAAIPNVPSAWQPWFETIRRVFNAHTQLVSIQQELDVARRMQQSIVPTRFPSRRDVQIFARMLPAKEVGGDFYDYFWLDDRRVGVVIADVSGKGVPAALFMAVSRTLLRATAPGAATPGECLALANDLLSQDNDATMFVTLFYGILDLDSGRLDYANGGHNPPCVLTPDGAVSRLPRTSGMALGVLEGTSFGEGCVTLQPGSTLLLYTDGVTEAFNLQSEEFTEKRLIATLAGRHGTMPQALVDVVVEAVESFAAGAPQADDLTCLAIRFAAPMQAETDVAP